MIALFSIHGDSSTNNIIDWLINFGVKHIRINLEDEDPKKLKIEITNEKYNVSLKLKNGNVLNLSEVNFCLFRGGLFLKSDYYFSPDCLLPEELANFHANSEIETLKKIFYYEIDKKSIGSPLTFNINKLITLKIASDMGFAIPSTIVGTCNCEIQAFFKNHQSVITKSISEAVSFPFDSNYYSQSTKCVNIETIPKEFFPSLFQTNVLKKKEIRTFFLENNDYSISIISKTTDYRISYKTNYFETFKLDEANKQKCIKLLNILGLKSGSFDFILNDQDQLIFLEVNPIGQFDWVSIIGGYNLDFEIAKYLKMKNDEKNKN